MSEEVKPELYASDVKKPWQSKTLWVNLILAILAFFPQAKDYVGVDVLGSLFFIANTVLRATTKSGISFK